MVEVYVMSAFSKDSRGGNKAGVVFDRPDLTTEQKMEIAGKLGYSETAFVQKSDAADLKLEYFTPTEEVPLCGHATIATFAAMHMLGMLESRTCRIETGAGILQVRVDEDGLVIMEQNCPEYGAVLPAEKLEAAMGCSGAEFSGAECFSATMPIQIVSTGLRDILLPMRSLKALEEAEPDFENMAELSKEQNVVGVHAFACMETIENMEAMSDIKDIADMADIAEGANLKAGEVTAVCRNFAPLYGIDEESATGTSNCALACYLFRLGKRASEYIFEQGYQLGQISRIIVRLDTAGDEIRAVYVGGYGYLVETITLPVS